jgi:hypothetical protein
MRDAVSLPPDRPEAVGPSYCTASLDQSRCVSPPRIRKEIADFPRGKYKGMLIEHVGLMIDNPDPCRIKVGGVEQGALSWGGTVRLKHLAQR